MYLKKIRRPFLKLFFSQSLTGGLTIILPLAIITFVCGKVLQFVSELVAPAAHMFDQLGWPVFLSDLIVVFIMLTICSLLGVFIRTKAGDWLFSKFEVSVLDGLVGYRTLKEVTSILLGKESSPFQGDVAKVWLYGRTVSTWTIGIITSHHLDGSYTVFVPTAPSPASGVVYNLNADQVEVRSDIPLEQAMKVTIACGAGASAIFEKEAVKN